MDNVLKFSFSVNYELPPLVEFLKFKLLKNNQGGLIILMHQIIKNILKNIVTKVFSEEKKMSLCTLLCP